MLFLVTMEAFSRMLKRMEGASLLCGFRVDGERGGGESVSHLFFILFYFVMQMWSNSFMFICYFFVMAPRRVSCFIWTVIWDRILTGDNLRSRLFDFVDWCIVCRCCGEVVDHLLLHCGKARR